MSGYSVVHVDEIPEASDGDVLIRPVRHHLGIEGFGVNAWRGPNAGDRLIPEHQEANDTEDEAERNEELYFVAQGRAVFELDGERHDAPAGTFVFVRPRVNRTAFAEEPGTMVVAVGGTPGQAYVPIGWELWHPLRHLYAAGEYAEVVERGREVLATNPPYGLLYYNVACCESLVGDKAEAMEHLRKAIELTPEMRDYAEKDSDLDAIRGEPGFQELVASPAQAT